MSTSAQKSLSTIDSFLGAVGQSVKTAAAPLSEAGSIGGETSHPVRNVDDRLEKAKEGARSAENAKDLKEDQGATAVGESKSAAAKSFDLIGRLAKRASEGSDNPPGTASEDQLQIGTNKQPTGDDPANETNKAKAGKEDPGSSHPARTDNDALDGHKYAYDANTSLEKMAADLQEVGNDLCARIEIYSQDLEKSAGAAATGTHTGTGTTQPHVKQASNAGILTPQLAQQAGWEVAGILTGTMDKSASDQMVRNEVKGIIKEAFDDADRVAEFLQGRARAMRTKRAGEGMPGGPDDAAPPPDDEGAEAGGGAGPGPGMGGDPMGGMGGGDPSGGMGGGMGGPPGGGAGGGGQIGPEAIDAICQEMQCTPEDLLNALMQTAGGGAAGAGGLGGAPGPDAGAPPPGGGAMPPPPGGAGGPPPGMEVAASDKRAHAVKVAEVVGYIKEVIARSKR